MKELSQIMIFLLGCSAIWVVGRKEPWRKYGFLLGLCAQPFWMVTAITNEQWGILAMSFFYTYSWAQGLYNNWKADKAQGLNLPTVEQLKILFDVGERFRGTGRTTLMAQAFMEIAKENPGTWVSPIDHSNNMGKWDKHRIFDTIYRLSKKSQDSFYFDRTGLQFKCIITSAGQSNTTPWNL